MIIVRDRIQGDEDPDPALVDTPIRDRGLSPHRSLITSVQQAFEILEHQEQVVRIGRAGLEFP